MTVNRRIPTAPQDSFLGRSFEVQRAVSALDACVASSGRLITIEGEPGIGKTRLARNIADIAIDRGFLTLTGSFFDDESEITLSGWREVLGRLVDVLPTELHPDEQDQEYLARLLPGLYASARETQVSPHERLLSSDSDFSRFLMFQAVSRLLSSAASWKPLMIRFEDLHWADPSSIELLRHIGRTSGQSPVIILATLRDTHLNFDGVIRDLTVELSGDEGVERMKLSALDDNNARELVKLTSAVRLSVPDLNEIVMRTGRNPFYIVEMTRWWNSRSDGSAKLGIPATINDSVKHRLSDLSGQARSLLETMSVMGNSTDTELISTLRTDLERDSLDELLSECINSGFVEVNESGQVVFRHWLLRDAIYRSLPTLAARTEHSRVASALQGIPGSETAAIAHHLDRSMIRESRLDAARMFLEAGLASMQAQGWETSEVALNRALAISTELGDDSLRPELLRGLGRSLLPLDPARAYPHLVEAFDIYSERGNETNALEVALINARPLIGQDVGERVLRERGLRVAPKGSRAAGILHSRVGLVSALAEADFEIAEVQIAEAESIARELNDERVRLFADSARAMFLYVTFQLDNALSKVSDALRLARRQGDLLTEGSLLFFYGDLSMWLQKPDGLRQAGKRMTVIGQRIEEPRISIIGESHLVRLDMLLGRFDSALAQRPDVINKFSFAYQLAEAQVALEKNDPEKLLRSIQSLVELVADSQPQVRAHVATALAIFGLMTGTPRWPDEIRMLVAGIEPRQGQLQAVHEWANGARLMLAVSERDAETAEPLISSLEQLNDIVVEWGPLRRFLAAAKALTGDTDGMHRDYEAAIEISRRLALQPIYAWTCFEYAETLSNFDKSGDHSSKTDELLRESNRIARTLGMRMLESRIRSLRSSRDGESRNNLGDLTPRELQVLEMIAGGHTNKEISFALGASLNTIYRHTNSIFTKLGVSNRTEAALTYRQAVDRSAEQR